MGYVVALASLEKQLISSCKYRYIYAVSGYQMQVGYFNELFYGYAIDAGGSRHPVGSLSYRTISGQCWYEAQAMLSDMKLGHYFHVPPRATLIAQVWGILIGVPVNYATILWVCNTKGAILTGDLDDPNNQWTGQTVISLNNQGISFALIGPKRLFADAMYSPMLYGFAVGGLAPFILRGLHWLRPKWGFDKVSVPMFGGTLEDLYVPVSFHWDRLYTDILIPAMEISLTTGLLGSSSAPLTMCTSRSVRPFSLFYCFT